MKLENGWLGPPRLLERRIEHVTSDKGRADDEPKLRRVELSDAEDCPVHGADECELNACLTVGCDRVSAFCIECGRKARADITAANAELRDKLATVESDERAMALRFDTEKAELLEKVRGLEAERDGLRPQLTQAQSDLAAARIVLGWRDTALATRARELQQCQDSLQGDVAAVTAERDELARKLEEAMKPKAERLICPWRDANGVLCGELHVDRGEFATKPHHTHSCQRCGNTWRPAVHHTVGVEFLPGFRDAPLEAPPVPPQPGSLLEGLRAVAESTPAMCEKVAVNPSGFIVPQPLPRLLEPGSALEVGATYRITELDPEDGDTHHAAGDILPAIDSSRGGFGIDYRWRQSGFWLAWSPQGSTWVTGLELVSPAAEPAPGETVGEE